MHGDPAQQRLQYILLRGKLLHFAVGNLGALEDGQGNEFGAVADQDGAFFFGAAYGQLHAAFDVEPRNLLEYAYPLGLGRLRLGLDSG